MFCHNENYLLHRKLSVPNQLSLKYTRADAYNVLNVYIFSHTRTLTDLSTKLKNIS